MNQQCNRVSPTLSHCNTILKPVPHAMLDQNDTQRSQVPEQISYWYQFGYADTHFVSGTRIKISDQKDNWISSNVVKLIGCRQANQDTVKHQKSNQYMILPSRSRMWTDCPSDCRTLEYCLSGSLALVLASPEPVARPSFCSGDECGNEADPRAHACGPPSNPPDRRLPGGVPFEGGGGGGTGTPRRGETDCECRRSPTPGISLDISCLSCACPTSSSRIFFSSSSLCSIPAGAAAGVLKTTEADSSSNRASCRHHRPPRAP